ncbi:MAG: hypothetical protein COY82_00030, partial [Parcubacteria group bacterium CG_4_10_14_0_8_um_filter_35_7]
RFPCPGIETFNSIALTKIGLIKPKQKNKRTQEHKNRRIKIGLILMNFFINGSRNNPLVPPYFKGEEKKIPLAPFYKGGRKIELNKRNLSVGKNKVDLPR